MENIFYKLVKNENSMTELFCNLLNYKIFRDKFFELFINDKKIIDRIKYNAFETQFKDSNIQPDIFIKNDDICIMIENKIEYSTGLTGNQPSGYIDYLSKIQNVCNKYLIFITPEKYYHKDKIEKYKNQNNIIIKLIQWEDIIKLLDDNELININPFFYHFYDLLHQRYIPEIINFTYEEINIMFSNKIPVIVIKLDNIIKGINNMISSKYDNDLNLKIYKTYDFSEDYENGIYFQNKSNKNLLYFGIWFKFWINKENKDNSPLCFGVNDNYLEGAKTIFFNEYKDKDWIKINNFYAIPIGKDILEKNNNNNCIEKISEILDKIIQKMINIK